MDAMAGCSHCGHTEETDRSVATGRRVGPCPRCGHALRALGPLGSRLLAAGSGPSKAGEPLGESPKPRRKRHE
jgi:transposase